MALVWAWWLLATWRWIISFAPIALSNAINGSPNDDASTKTSPKDSSKEVITYKDEFSYIESIETNKSKKFMKYLQIETFFEIWFKDLDLKTE